MHSHVQLLWMQNKYSPFNVNPKWTVKSGCLARSTWHANKNKQNIVINLPLSFLSKYSAAWRSCAILYMIAMPHRSEEKLQAISNPEERSQHIHVCFGFVRLCTLRQARVCLLAIWIIHRQVGVDWCMTSVLWILTRSTTNQRRCNKYVRAELGHVKMTHPSLLIPNDRLVT